MARLRITRVIWEESERGGNNDNTRSTEPDTTTEVVQPRSRRRGIIIVVIAMLIVGAVAFWWHSTFTEDTDDAQINGHLIQVSSRIAGQVQKVYVDENQLVKKGDLIAELDPRDYQVAVENAKAVLASAKANAAAANVAVPLTTINTGSNLTSADIGRERRACRGDAGAAAVAGSACARYPGAGQQCQGPGGPGALQATGGKRRDQQAAV